MQAQTKTYTYTYHKLNKRKEGTSLEDIRIAQENHNSREPRTTGKVPIEPLEGLEVNHEALEPFHEPYALFYSTFWGEVRHQIAIFLIYIYTYY